MDEPPPIKDGWLRLVGIPGFALGIPAVTGLLGPLTPGDARFWLGLGWFLLLSTAIWHGNRWLLFQQRRHVGWFDDPIRKLMVLAGAVVLGTVPVTMGFLVLWYRVADIGPVQWDVIKLCTLINVICVIFITHAYETVFLIQERRTDLVRVTELEHARVTAELEALRAQVDPHFMFNSITTLSHLIQEDPAAARAFCDHLARVYRYILGNRHRELVQLADELTFADTYVALLRLRFGAALLLHRPDVHDGMDRFLLPPNSLQVLIENAVKHNTFSREDPLHIHVDVDGLSVTVHNARRPRLDDVPSPGVGLRNLAERYRLVLHASPQILNDGVTFQVRLPLAQV